MSKGDWVVIGVTLLVCGLWGLYIYHTFKKSVKGDLT